MERVVNPPKGQAKNGFIVASQGKFSEWTKERQSLGMPFQMLRCEEEGKWLASQQLETSPNLLPTIEPQRDCYSNVYLHNYFP